MKEPFSKRFFDIFVSSIGLILSSWLWVLIWIAIIIEDGFPVFFRHKRIGKHGKLFNSLKFRSMTKHTLKEKVNYQAIENDPRITRIGRFLRKTAIDELPQLLNIFFGEMSFVGPRALLPSEIEACSNGKCIHIYDIPGYEKRIEVKPGLTGIAQVYAPRDITRRHKFKYDLLYIKKMNTFLDIKLILLSFLVTFKGRWEKRGLKLKMLEKTK